MTQLGSMSDAEQLGRGQLPWWKDLKKHVLGRDHGFRSVRLQLKGLKGKDLRTLKGIMAGVCCLPEKDVKGQQDRKAAASPECLRSLGREH